MRKGRSWPNMHVAVHVLAHTRGPQTWPMTCNIPARIPEFPQYTVPEKLAIVSATVC